MSSAKPLNGHQRRRRETRRQLLQAATELCVERGVERVSIDAICQAAGVAKGSFYNHFESREQLFDVVLRDSVDRHFTNLHEYEPQIEDPLTLAIARSEYGFRILLDNPTLCRLLLQAGPAQPGDTVERGMRLGIGEQLRNAAEAGAFAHLDKELVYAAYFGVVSQTLRALLASSAPIDSVRSARELTQLCFAVLGLPYHSQPHTNEEINRD
jgi:AcrR family transcriptional regulator